MNRSFWVVLGAIALTPGCIGGDPEPMPPEMKARMEARMEASAESNTPPPAAASQPVSQTVTMEKARPGVGVKGSRYGGGIITEPVSAYFRAGQTVAFNIQIPHGMKAFHALNGRYPRDWDEFEREILKPAQIQLPELPVGKEYYYDPKKGELMVKTVQ